MTREPLTLSDCHRLDLYLNEYSPSSDSLTTISTTARRGNNRSSSSSSTMRVSEAFGLRQRVRIGNNHGQTPSSSANVRRAEALRNEATAALVGLFVYQSNRNNQQGQNRTNEQEQPSVENRSNPQIPRMGFDLNNQSNVLVAVENAVERSVEGLRIIDDDESHVAATERGEWDDVQAAFPRLPSVDGQEATSTSSATSTSISTGWAVNHDFLRNVRETARQYEQQEADRQRRLEEAKQIVKAQADREQHERRWRQREEAAKRVAQRQAELAEQMEVAQARAEIARWREEQWNKMMVLQERITMQDQNRKRLEAEQKRQESRAVLESEAALVEEEKKKADAENEAESERRREEKAAAKRKRARERKKTKKKEEQKLAAEQKKRTDMEAKKAASVKKCACCGDGILDCGFEKFGQTFCSPKCARSGAAPSLS